MLLPVEVLKEVISHSYVSPSGALTHCGALLPTPISDACLVKEALGITAVASPPPQRKCWSCKKPVHFESVNTQNRCPERFTMVVLTTAYACASQRWSHSELWEEFGGVANHVFGTLRAFLDINRL